jgi:tetratricopeptide (TPR) repeat protein
MVSKKKIRLIKNKIHMKKAGLIIVGLVIGLTAFSQGQYGATPKDSITCIENLIYKDYLKSDPKLAHKLWRVAYNVCPQSQKSLYINGVDIYKDLADAEKDPVKKELYLDTMFSIYDQRIEMFGQRGYVLGYKGQSMLVNRQDKKEETFEILNEAIGLTKDNSQAGTLVATMFAIINLEKEGKKTKEEVVAMYEKTIAICNANKDDPKQSDNYAKADEQINSVTAPYLDCEVLVPMAEKNFEANKANVDWLRNTVRLLKVKKCYEADIFSKVAEAYFKLEPSAEGAESMGKLFLGKRDFDKAIDFFKKALDMAKTDAEKAEYNFSIAQAYSYAKQYSSARTYALKAAGLKSGWGEPYLLIGDCYAQSASSCDDGELGKWGVYWVAVDQYSKAKAVDGSVTSEANKKIASMSARYPATKDLFFYGKKAGDSYTVGCWINESTSIRTQ